MELGMLLHAEDLHDFKEKKISQSADTIWLLNTSLWESGKVFIDVKEMS